jgi:Fic family protein
MASENEHADTPRASRPHGRYVTQLWRGNPLGYGRRSQLSFKYEAFVPTPIANLEIALPGDLVQRLIAAHEAMIGLDSGPIGASLEVLARPLLRAESVASSRIEGLVLGHRRLAQALFQPAEADRIARAVVGNVAAMERAIQIGSDPRPLETEDLLAIHRTLLTDPSEAEIAGVLRDRQNWIGGRDDSPQRADFIPPPAAEVPALVDDLCTFLNRTDLPALVQAAIGHAQFETIHPFADGNGRVGRCLIQIVLRRRNTIMRYVPPISVVLAANATSYIAGLVGYREGRLIEWIALMIRATELAVERAAELSEWLDQLNAAWRERANQPRANSAVSRLLALLPGNPVMSIALAEELLGVTGEAARLAVQQLETTGILTPTVLKRRRNRVWEAREVYALLTDWENDLELPYDGAARRRTIQI